MFSCMHDFGSSYMDYVCAIAFHAYIYLNLIVLWSMPLALDFALTWSVLVAIA